MPRLNIKSTKAAFVKLLKDTEEDKASGGMSDKVLYAQCVLMALAKELEIEIKPEDYK